MDLKPKGWYKLSQLAEYPGTSHEMLRELSKNKDARVRWGVARNFNAPVELLANLACDENAAVRRQVVKNPNCPAWLKVAEQINGM